MPTATKAPPTPTDTDTPETTTEFEFVVEDFCYNRSKVTVRATDRDDASERLQEKVGVPFSCAWVPALGERHP